MFVPAKPITSVNGFPIRPGFYQEFATLTDEGSLVALHEAWASKITKAMGTECPRCRGRGYTRRDLNVGCSECHGTGRIE